MARQFGGVTARVSCGWPYAKRSHASNHETQRRKVEASFEESDPSVSGDLKPLSNGQDEIVG
jgi:hypothetical protein